jgi:hypothetical protein
LKSYYTNSIYPINRSDEKPSPPGDVIIKTIADYPPELQQRWNSITGYVKPTRTETLAPQRKPYNPGKTKAHSWEKKGGEGA